METAEEIILSPDHIPVLSKANAKSFHEMAKERIYEHGGVFEYLEAIKFFAKLNDIVFGNSGAKIESDKEFVEYAIEEIKKNGNGGDKSEYKTARGVKFTLAEVGTAYDFSKCNDPELIELEAKAKEANDALKARKEMLKMVPSSGMDLLTRDSELVRIYPPSKSSKSSFKISLPR
jgi:hypothetical protein